MGRLNARLTIEAPEEQEDLLGVERGGVRPGRRPVEDLLCRGDERVG